ncbi:60S ribosomal protein L18a-like protein isoform X2 [Oryza brachyantha]|uniref:60S ribosomal protein L18a-like protein isoform X2 n=1 Tax=Oryza brachyantha TaxID=4533 RepID=UPI0007764304|nr:60S ribosomal protein L18a-like protein isoform X2 [Oryza brachyantha]
MDMQETKGPKDPAAKLPSRSPFAAPAPPPYHHHHYGTFSPPPPPQQQPVGAASSLPFPAGCAAQGVVAFPCTVQQQVLVERLPFREPPLPFCGAGVGWTLFLLGFFLAAMPWYAGAFILFFIALDHREKPGLIACTIAGIVAIVPFILNGIRMHPFW